MNFARRILVVVIALVASRAWAEDVHPNGRAAAEAAVANLVVAPGLEAKLFASEPMVVNPSAMDVDSRGRVWIAEGANYRLFQKWGKLRPDGDRILILQDTDGDGMADKSTVFYQGNDVNTALGVCVLGDKVIVSCSPNILVLEDKNHDDKADGPPKILFTGIEGTDHDHGAHAFQFGPDGKLYFNLGNAGLQLKTPDGKWVVDKDGNEVRAHRHPYQEGLVLRCNLDGSEVETLAWNFRNNFEVTPDSFGTLWQSDNDDDGNKGVRINYVMEGGNFGYKDEMTGASWGQKRTAMEAEIPRRHWHLDDPGVVPTLLLTGGGSPTGICFNEGNLLPEIFRNQMIHCDAGPRVVRAYPVTKSGAGYEATIANIVESPNDTWFRPSDAVMAPDGSLYIADWNDAGVGGHYMADQKLETMTGRVIRVAPPGVKATVPKLDLTSAKGAVAALQSPNGATRYLAWTTLNGMGAKAEGELGKLAKSPEARQRARALQLLVRLPGKAAQYVDQALHDGSDDVRIVGLRMARELKLDIIPLVKQLTADPSYQVLRECSIALRHNTSAEMPGLWAQLAKRYQGQDRWYLEALGIGADKNWDACLSAYLAANGGLWNTTSARLIIWRSRAKATPALLVKILKDPSTTAAEKPHYVRAMDFQSGKEKEAALLEMLSVN
ncbi:MAG TPA: PVC-type heme-binding CxxCH protein [Candidatus Limnocylindria bacterium]|jgi:putative membrane-bound dehydrogenase-like protein|nr:PVC-type heme-binding CxxCH protein [Candidatus Limnocylindria bacterium]